MRFRSSTAKRGRGTAPREAVAVVQRRHAVGLRLPPPVLHQPPRLGGGEVVGLREVGVEVVEFPVVGDTAPPPTYCILSVIFQPRATISPAAARGAPGGIRRPARAG